MRICIWDMDNEYVHSVDERSMNAFHSSLTLIQENNYTILYGADGGTLTPYEEEINEDGKRYFLKELQGVEL